LRDGFAAIMSLATNTTPFLAAVFALTAATGAAQEPILTVSGTGTATTYSHDDLLALPQHRVATTTSVTDGVVAFDGFLIRTLLGDDLPDDAVVVATALNDYQVEIPVTDFARYDVIGAMSMDGETLSPRDKGPIWIVYPRDDHPELQDIRYDTRWVWQLVSLQVQ